MPQVSERAVQLANQVLHYMCECDRRGLKPDEIRVNSSDYKELTGTEPPSSGKFHLWGLTLVIDEQTNEPTVSGPL